MKIFKDNNDWNEKAIVGFIAFLIMCMIMMADMSDDKMLILINLLSDF